MVDIIECRSRKAVTQVKNTKSEIPERFNRLPLLGFSYFPVSGGKSKSQTTCKLLSAIQETIPIDRMLCRLNISMD